MGRWALWLLAALLAACASKPVVPLPSPRMLFNDALFAAPTERIDAAAIFRLTPAMQAYFDDVIAPMQHRRGMQRGLIDALYSSDKLMLRYDNDFTRSASQAFEARAGNCLSLVIMTAAFARHAEMPVRYHSVHVDPTWGRRGDLYFNFGHVNVSLGRGPMRSAGVEFNGNDWLTIDFLPQADLRGQRYELIEERTLLAMYFNNRAAEALAAGKVDDAYWWSRAAIENDPQLLIAYNTLGVVYRRHGKLDDSERVLRFAHALEPRNTNVLGNLAQLLAERGQREESAALLAMLERLQPDPPFKYFNEGLAAMQRGDYRAARNLFERELARDPDYHEFHFWLALAHLQLGDTWKARKHLAAAAENSGSLEEQARYSAKLEKLKAAAVH
ncbi:tetratricopeptide repeat protein [Aquincola sp. S2]|uniref:Tetratricopeptide repeat protein n=1 Tax=Pseudaquabacterium terrae TaxID=2732868 RepID=A0ABX2EH27_9BURK|nr:tetratricopeptide repeat protein [Aquabacterium terrae]NRF67950.1 tetratricopeptide repeat protein [Aquabacterium terrae]